MFGGQNFGIEVERNKLIFLGLYQQVNAIGFRGKPYRIAKFGWGDGPYRLAVGRVVAGYLGLVTVQKAIVKIVGVGYSRINLILVYLKIPKGPGLIVFGVEGIKLPVVIFVGPPRTTVESVWKAHRLL